MEPASSSGKPGDEVSFAGPGKLGCEDAHRRGNFVVSVVADRLDARATGCQGRAHDKLMTRATGI